MSDTHQYADWGTLLVETDIDREILAPLILWMPTYLSQLERERDFVSHFMPRPTRDGYSNALLDTSFPDGRLPSIIVTTAQTEGDPEPILMDADAAYSATWRVNVSAITRGRTPPETRELASLYSGCVRRILVQRPFALGTVHWRGSLVTPFTDLSGGGRYLAAGVNRFTVFTDTVLTGDGPIVPEEGDPPYPPADPNNPDAPYDPMVLVQQVVTDILARS